MERLRDTRPSLRVEDPKSIDFVAYFDVSVKNHMNPDKFGPKVSGFGGNLFLYQEKFHMMGLQW
jgi:hypothetical protein